MTEVPVAGNDSATAEKEMTESAVGIPVQKEPEAEAVGESVVESVTAEVPTDLAEQPQPQPDEPAAESPTESSEDKSKTKRPRKSAPRKAAGTKALVVLRDGRVQFADPETVLVVDLDEASAPDADVHDVVDKLTELRDAVDCPGKADAVRALTELIQEKALG